MSKPPLTINEPTATGWLRMELYGDRDKARGYTHTARTVLGGLRSRMGVNERIAAGEGGGFYHQNVTLEDGTTIQAITNDGMDTLRIHASSSFIQPVQTTREEEELQPVPYMWVGARIKWAGSTFYNVGDGSGVPWYGLMVSLAEPAGKGGEPNGLLWTTTNAGWQVPASADLSDAAALMTPSTIAGLVQTMHTVWSGAPPFHVFPIGWHNLALDDKTYSDRLFFSKNGLLGYDAQWCLSSTPAAQSLTPFDPLLPATNQLSGRNFGSALGDLQALGYAVAPWDVVYVLDADTAAKQTDDRKHILNAQAILERAGMATGTARVLPGDYLLNLGAWGDNRIYSSRQNEAVATLDPTLWVRTGLADFAEYRTTNKLLPMAVEIEVRLGKEPLQQTFNFELVLPRYDSSNRNAFPFGTADYGLDACASPDGQNTMANWHTQSIAINVDNGTAQLSDTLPDGVFMRSNFSYDDYKYKRYPLEIYVHGDYGVSQVANDNYASNAAFAIAQLLDEMTTGAWGPNIEIRERLFAAIKAAGVVLRKGWVWRYDVQANTFAALPIASSEASYTYTGTNYVPYFYWFYPYRIQAKNRCSKVFAVLLSAAQSGFQVENGNKLMTDEPPGLYDATACCPENFFA